jgi:tetratricopeptide (TPR) repeat protein
VPDDTDTLFWLIVGCQLTGQRESAHALTRRMLRLDPLNSYTHMMLGFAEWLDGNYEEGLVHLRRMTEIDPNNPLGALIIPMLIGMAGRHAEACEAFATFHTAWPQHPFALVARAYELALRGDAEAARASITAELLQMMGSDLQYSSWVAEIYALIGDRDLALDWFERAIQRGYVHYPYFAEHDRFLDGLRDEPRFQDLLERCRTEWQRATGPAVQDIA